MNQIVNFKQYGSAAALTTTFGNKWLYIGRANPHYGLKASPLANPFRRHDFGNQPGATLPQYRRHLWQRIKAGDETVINALQAIDEETVLVCWCDGACHGQVVRDAAAWLRGARGES